MFDSCTIRPTAKKMPGSGFKQTNSSKHFLFQDTRHAQMMHPMQTRLFQWKERQSLVIFQDYQLAACFSSTLKHLSGDYSNLQTLLTSFLLNSDTMRNSIVRSCLLTWFSVKPFNKRQVYFTGWGIAVNENTGDRSLYILNVHASLFTSKEFVNQLACV